MLADAAELQCMCWLLLKACWVQEVEEVLKLWACGLQTLAPWACSGLLR